jgi:hypothetical protein
VLELPPTADEPGLVVSPLVEEPTPGLVLDPGVVVLELDPDWPAAGAPEASLLLELEPLFKPLDWPVELLLVSEPYWPVLLRELPVCESLEAGAPDSREPELLEPDPMEEPELPLELVPLL